MWRRASSYPLALGLAAGALISGVVLPFAIDESTTSVDSGSALAADGLDQDGGVDYGSTDESSGLDGGTGNEGGPGVSGPAGPGAGSTPGSNSSAGGGGVGGNAVTGAPLPASDRGVTATSVKLGLLILNVSGVQQVGFAAGVDSEGQRKAWDAYVADLNARGGINGRKVEPVFATYDVLDQDTYLAACRALTQDAKVFAVVDGAGTFYGAAQVCVTQESRTPLFGLGSYGTRQDFYDRADGMLFTAFPSGNRTMRVFADELAKAGDLRGAKLGIVSDQEDDQTVDLLERELAQRGGKVVYRMAFSPDQAEAASQVPVEVNRMRGSGADTVLLMGTTIAQTQFVQQADAQGWRPKWRTSDWRYGSQDVGAENMPASFEGALSYGARRAPEGEEVAGMPEAKAESECRQVYERGTGEQLARSDTNYSLYTIMCSALRAVVAGAAAAGPDLTRQTWSRAMQSLGPFEIASLGPAAFRPGRFDAAEAVRTYRWAYSCKCWIPASDYRPMAF